CFLFHDTPPTVIYTLSLHDALPIWQAERSRAYPVPPQPQRAGGGQQAVQAAAQASPPPRRPFTPADSGVINSFKVCSDVQCRTSHTVDAALMKIGQHIAMYVDTAAPTP